MQAERTERAQHGPYELRLGPWRSDLMITRNDGDRRFTVAFVDNEDQWDRFVAAIEAGADEVTAVHAIDAEADLA